MLRNWEVQTRRGSVYVVSSRVNNKPPALVSTFASIVLLYSYTIFFSSRFILHQKIFCVIFRRHFTFHIRERINNQLRKGRREINQKVIIYLWKFSVEEMDNFRILLLFFLLRISCETSSQCRYELATLSILRLNSNFLLKSTKYSNFSSNHLNGDTKVNDSKIQRFFFRFSSFLRLRLAALRINLFIEYDNSELILWISQKFRAF